MPKIKSAKEIDEQREEETKSDVAEFLDNSQSSEEEEEEKPTSEEEEEQPKSDEGEEEEEEDDEEQPSGEEDESDEGDGKEEEEDETPEETIARLRKTVEDLSGDQKIETQKKESDSDEEEEDEPEKPTVEDTSENNFDDLNFVSAEDFEKIQSDPKALNNLLIKVAQIAAGQAREKVMQDIPELVRTTASRQTNLMNKVSKFYSENPDLKEYKKYVSNKANEIQSDNPDLNIDEIFERTAKEVRKDLALSQKAKEKEEERKNGEDQPAFAGGSKGGGRSQGVDTRSDQQKQIDDIL